ncbi:TonB-dependent receptor [Candidatus Ulvibacter alkanivorans]|uniref:TonB-dependent receptor n=1 Tax=Candidatus Ulvibacter alkanivorans TaxID=2267620 RepID=UPI000DF38B6C|nr:TonB-dependent receptor [Candidatus Ulvibacter alkanivorans]
MSNKRIASLTLFLVLSVTFTAFAQDEKEDLGTEVVNIVKPYTPTISDAFKVKETPSINDSVTTKKRPVQYSIFSVPVASTFTPAKGKATTVERAKPIKLYDNYATLGFGNYTSILAELYSNFEISRTDNAGFFFRHNSSQNGIDDIRLQNKYYDTRLDGNYISRQRDATYGLDAGIQHQLYNWYGLSDFYSESLSDEMVNDIDPQQTYISGYVGGSIAFDESIFEKATANIRYLGDAFGSSEFNITATPEFSFPLTDFTLKIDGEVDYLSGSFDQNFFNATGIDYGYLNAGVIPSLVYLNEDLTLSLGVAAFVSLATEQSETEFFIYPRINASYRLVDELLIVYGGAQGDLEQNSYYDFKETNPFVSPTLFIAPTSNLYEGFVGLKGKLSNSVGYNVRAGYGKDENKALFIANPSIDDPTDISEPYQYGNSFRVVYDDMNTLEVFGELKVAVSEDFSLGVNGSFYSYDTTFQAQPWNLPEIEASVFSNFNISEQLYGGATVFFTGERMDLESLSGPFVDDTMEVTLDSYIDANIHLGYRVNDRLSIFAKGSNLLSDNYEKWLNYPVQGIQGILGATYKFDW